LRIDTGRIASLVGAAAAAIAVFAPPVAAVAAPATGTVLGSGSAGAIGGSYIVVLRPGATGGGLMQRYGGEVTENYQTAVRGFSATMTAQQARRLAADPAVRYVEQDATVALAGGTPAWGLDRIDQRPRALSKTYAAPSAAGVTAYVLDTGIRIAHREFGGRAVNGYDFVDDDDVAQDCNGHGTHVAATVGGSTWGVAKDVKLVAVRVLGCNGSGSYSHIIAGIDWVTQQVTKHAHGPAVANLSLGGPVSRALDDAVDRSIAAGVTYAVAAGNDNKDACRQSPAHDPAAITVGATDDKDKRASFSNYGSCLDLFAPGVRIESASNKSNTATMLMSGTSMASPHVAGAAALVLGAHPDWTPAQVRDELVAQATPDAVSSAGRGSPDKLLFTGFLNPQAGATSHR
jgi:subtilisin family serine protease